MRNGKVHILLLCMFEIRVVLIFRSAQECFIKFVFVYSFLYQQEFEVINFNDYYDNGFFPLLLFF